MYSDDLEFYDSLVKRGLNPCDIEVFSRLLKIVSECKIGLLRLKFSIELISANPPLHNSDYAYRWEPPINISGSGSSLAEASYIVVSMYNDMMKRAKEN